MIDVTVQVVNFIRSRSLNHRLFKIICQEFGAEHDVLLYHTDIRWLSRGQTFIRVFELRLEIFTFLKEKGSNLRDHFTVPTFIKSLAYLCDIFSHLNDLNRSLQGPEVTIFDTSEKVSAFKKKLLLWKRRLQQRNYANFPRLEDMSVSGDRNEDIVPYSVKDQAVDHLESLYKTFDEYFEKNNFQNNQWIRDPFNFPLDSMPDDDSRKEDIIDLQSQALLRQSFSTQDIGDFWCLQLRAFPVLAKEAICCLIPFVTTYLCESGFSTLVNIKTKSRNRLDPKHDIRIALSRNIPRFSLLIAKKQQQPSH